MSDHEFATWYHESREITIVELAQCSGLSEAELRELVEYGALSFTRESMFASDCLARLRTAVRLRNDLELETTAFALVVSFLERINELEARVRALNAKTPR